MTAKWCNCGNRFAHEHELRDCAKCGGPMCPECLYIPHIGCTNRCVRCRGKDHDLLLMLARLAQALIVPDDFSQAERLAMCADAHALIHKTEGRK